VVVNEDLKQKGNRDAGMKKVDNELDTDANGSPKSEEKEEETPTLQRIRKEMQGKRRLVVLVDTDAWEAGLVSRQYVNDVTQEFAK
jgi:hypothetical protein